MSTSSATHLGAGTRLGAAELTVTDLDRSVAYYQDAIGLSQHSRDGQTAALGAGGEDLLVLHERPDARPAGRHAGLYHLALLHPDREELGRAVMRLAATRTGIEGASDHGVSEAIYLSDPDGNGLELYADRPRDQWPPADTGERVRMFVQPLDLRDVVAGVQGEQPQRRATEGLVMGHMHLHVSDLRAAVAFYGDVLGLELMTGLPSAAFMAAGGYHHHLGINTWRGEGVPPAPEDAVGLRSWTVVVEDADQLAALRERADAAGVEHADADGGLALRDPSGNRLVAVVR
jgi:catechol 2,3-dioxygenase